MRSSKRRTFAQMNLLVAGLASPPSILRMRPFSTVTSSVQESGQSSGQAVRTVEWPQVSDAGRAMPDYSWRPTASSGATRVVDLFFDVGTLAARAHIDAGGARMPGFCVVAAIQYPIGPPLHTTMAARLLGFFGSFQWRPVDVGRLWRDMAQPQHVTHAVIAF